MKIRIYMWVFLLMVLFGFHKHASASGLTVEQLGVQAVQAALAKLHVEPEAPNLVCITNAGYVKYNGQSTRGLYDVIPRISKISLGRGNLLPLHSQGNQRLWFAFAHKRSEKELFLTYVSTGGRGLQATRPINVYVAKKQSFDPFKKVLGDKTFSIVTLINGWADNIPEDLMNGALYHDHLCCGVFSGYFTVRFIQKHIPLKEQERYIYIGAPAWCQDDYIMYALNLTPGKRSYYTMAYPWSRPWKTKKKVYKKMGGIIITFDAGTNTGQAYLLRFDWHEDDFKQFVGMPDLRLDWRNQPWLHVWYNRFFLKHLDQPEEFVAVLRVKRLKSRKDLDRLVNMGTNPLQEMLGQDPTWGTDTD